MKPWTISVVETASIRGHRKGKWIALVLELEQQFKKLPVGKSLRIALPNLNQAKSLCHTARHRIKNPRAVVGYSSLENCVYVGKK